MSKLVKTSRNPHDLLIVKTIGGHAVVWYGDHSVFAKRFFCTADSDSYKAAHNWLESAKKNAARVRCWFRASA